MFVTDQTPKVTVANLRKCLHEGWPEISIHRRNGEHSDTGECWCDPLVLDAENLRMHARDLALLLQTFYAVH